MTGRVRTTALAPSGHTSGFRLARPHINGTCHVAERAIDKPTRLCQIVCIHLAPKYPARVWCN